MASSNLGGKEKPQELKAGFAETPTIYLGEFKFKFDLPDGRTGIISTVTNENNSQDVLQIVDKDNKLNPPTKNPMPLPISVISAIPIPRPPDGEIEIFCRGVDDKERRRIIVVNSNDFHIEQYNRETHPELFAIYWSSKAKPTIAQYNGMLCSLPKQDNPQILVYDLTKGNQLKFCGSLTLSDTTVLPTAITCAGSDLVVSQGRGLCEFFRVEPGFRNPQCSGAFPTYDAKAFEHLHTVQRFGIESKDGHYFDITVMHPMDDAIDRTVLWLSEFAKQKEAKWEVVRTDRFSIDERLSILPWKDKLYYCTRDGCVNIVNPHQVSQLRESLYTCPIATGKQDLDESQVFLREGGDAKTVDVCLVNDPAPMLVAHIPKEILDPNYYLEAAALVAEHTSLGSASPFRGRPSGVVFHVYEYLNDSQGRLRFFSLPSLPASSESANPSASASDDHTTDLKGPT